MQDINGLHELLDILHEIPEFKFLLTSKLQQDVLQQLFSLIRCRGEYNKHPTNLGLT